MVKVSLIVPVYNVEQWLVRCLESLVHQTLSDVQIIVINDGSLDDTQKIVDSYINRFPDMIESHFKPNSGLSDARNYGLTFAKGEYIGFVDSDDYCELDMFEKLYREATKEDADMAVCDWYSVDEAKGTKRVVREGRASDFGGSVSEKPGLLKVCQPYAWSKLYKRELFTKNDIRYPSGSIYEDIPVTFPLLFTANKVVKVDEPLYDHVSFRPGSITSAYNEKILDMFDNLASMNDFFMRDRAMTGLKKELCYINLRHTFARFMDFAKYDDRKLKKLILEAGWKHLGRYFHDWKKCHDFFDGVYGKSLKSFLVKRKFFWKLMILVPLSSRKRIKGLIKGRLGLFRRSLSNRNYYARCLKKPIAKKTVLFESFFGKELNDSPLALCREMAGDSGFTLYFTTNYENRTKHKKFLKNAGLQHVRLVPIKSRRYQKVLATAEYLVNNVTFPAYFVRREGQNYLNTWHGTPLKTLGSRSAGNLRDMLNSERNFLQANYLLYPNRYTYDNMFRDYNLEKLYTGTTLLCGYPRNDVFFNDTKRKSVRKAYALDGLQTIAYMPTWRGSNTRKPDLKAAGDETEEILKAFDEALSDGQKLFVNLHQLLKGKIKKGTYRHIEFFPEDIDNYSFLNAMDMLITDYSSVMFDFAVTKRPIVLFMYDYNDYMKDRGCYIDPGKLLFRKYYDLKDMTAFLKRRDFSLNVDDIECHLFLNKFAPFDRGDSARKIADRVFRNLNYGIEEKDYSKNGNVPRNLYICGSLLYPDDKKKLKEALNKKDTVVILEREKFDTAAAFTLAKEAAGYPWALVEPFMLLTKGEAVKINRLKWGGTPKVNHIFSGELKRILPGIRFSHVTREAEGWYGENLEIAVRKEINSRQEN